jgi:hypothetical protein
MPKRARPGRLVRIARHEKHQEMRRGKKKQKRQNMAQFKEQLLGVKTPKNHALNSLQQAEEPTSNEQDFKQILKNRARARRERFDSWRKGRKSRGSVRLFGYATDPHAFQAKLAIKTSRQAFHFEEPCLPYWMIPDEDDDAEQLKQDEEGKTEEEAAAEAAAEAAIFLQPLKMVHGEIVLTTPWEICLYVDTLLQAGSKVIKNRHTTANRGAAPYFPVSPEERNQCLRMLRSFHTTLVVPFWNLVEGKEDQKAESTKITATCTIIEELISSSSTTYAFNLRRPGVVEQWVAPLLHRLQALQLWEPSNDSIKEWLNKSLEYEEMSELTADTIRAFHQSKKGKRPNWIDLVTEENVWQ